MKLRIRGNSIRLRLTKEEVACFGESGSVEDRIAFGAGMDEEHLYVLETLDYGESITADLKSGRITLRIPRTIAERWTATKEVGMESNRDLDDEQQLRILVEKDFAWLKPRMDEDDRDTFPHPQQGEQC